MKNDGKSADFSEEKMFKRNYLVSNIEKLIEESVYYRTYSFEMKSDKVVIYNYSQDSGKGKIK
jgi:hypothetical protein